MKRLPILIILLISAAVAFGRKVRLTVITSVFLLISVSIAFGQDISKKERVGLDLSLDTVFVYEKFITKTKDVNVGAKITALDPALLEVFQSRSLAELLAENTSVHIKSMGVGALATASFRGAGASQTRVNWNGVNITPVMAGIFDFSQLPVFFADRVSLYYGSNDVKSGTGAVGGSVNIFSAPLWDGKREVNLSGEYGSFHTYTVKGNARYGTRKVSLKSRAYYQHSDNNFSYINKVTSNEPFAEQRKDAAYGMFSAMQEAHFRLSEQSILSSAVWYQQGERMLPPPLGVEVTSHERQKERNLRAYTGWDFFGEKRQLALKVAYIFYKLRYDKWYDNDYFSSVGNTNSSQTFHLSGDYSYAPSRELLMNTTLTYRHDIANAESYRDLDPEKYKIEDLEFEIPDLEPPVKKYRNILSWHNSVRWQICDRLLTDGRLMLETSDWKKPVVTYSLGFVGGIIPGILNLRGSAAYNYRFPSLNELYWRPGGNPDVLPEQGRSFDVTASLSLPITPQWKLSAELSSYLMLIDNWILWLPTDESAKGLGPSQSQWLWTPQNKRDVFSTGVEALAKIAYETKALKGSLSFNYSYTDSHSRTRQHVDDGSLLKQIPYVPKQKWNIRFSADYKRIFFNFQTTYVGVRFVTTDQSYFTYPYNVCNAQLGYSFLLGKVLFSPQLRVDNLFNSYYESTQYYPMPQRNLLASLIVTF